MVEEDKKKVDGEISNELVISGTINPNPKENRPSFLDFLSKLAPGKNIRTALDDILGARDGALIVVDCPNLRESSEGGFRVNCRFTPQKLAELSKMDGAIILSSDLNKILFANALLVPDTRIPSNETGTRHKTAERISKQLDTPSIAVSQRRGKVSLFYDNKKYVLQDSEALLRRATENLHILEKQREICNDLLTNLNILETTNLVSVGDVCSLLQRMEIITRVMATLKRYIIELGKEGVIIRMRVRELFKGIEPLMDFILKDYTARASSSKRILSGINFDSLLDSSVLSRLIFEDSPDKLIFPKGYRILSKLNLPEKELDNLINHFKNFGNILSADNENLEKVLKHKTESFKRGIEHLKEQIMLGKKI